MKRTNRTNQGAPGEDRGAAFRARLQQRADHPLLESDQLKAVYAEADLAQREKPRTGSPHSFDLPIRKIAAGIAAAAVLAVGITFATAEKKANDAGQRLVGHRAQRIEALGQSDGWGATRCANRQSALLEDGKCPLCGE